MTSNKLKDKINDLCLLHNVDPDKFDTDFIFREANILDTKDNDPLLLLLIDNRIRQLSIQDIPNKVASKSVKHAIDNAVAINAATHNVKIVIISVLLIVVVLLAIIYGVYRYGYKQGIEVGVAKTQNEELILKKRDQFTETNLYRKAYTLYNEGILDEIINCRVNGWKIKDGYCYPYQSRDGMISYWPMRWIQ